MCVVIITLVQVHFGMNNNCNSVFSKTSQSESRDLGGRNAKRSIKVGVTLAALMAGCGRVILGNAYIEPATSLHLTFSSELRISVVNFAFFL